MNCHSHDDILIDESKFSDDFFYILIDLWLLNWKKKKISLIAIKSCAAGL